MRDVNREMRRTFRAVLETPNGAVCVDVTLRGRRAGLDELTPDIHGLLDMAYPGVWVDNGTTCELQEGETEYE